VELAGQRGDEVEPEAVHVHFGHPVPQRVHDQPQRLVVAHVQAVPDARRVVVVLFVLIDQPVVGLAMWEAELVNDPPGAAISLAGRLAGVPDPRNPRGRRHQLVVVLVLTACATVLVGNDCVTAIWQWAAGTDKEILARIGTRYDAWTGRYVVLSEPTFRRVLTSVDGDAWTARSADTSSMCSPDTLSGPGVARDGQAHRNVNNALVRGRPRTRLPPSSCAPLSYARAPPRSDGRMAFRADSVVL
jgi:hypothetical protein